MADQHPLLLPWFCPRPINGCHLFRSELDMATIWQAHGGDRAKLPVVDFDSQMVACVFVDAGEYAVAPVIQDVEAQDGFVRVRYRFSRPVFSPVNNPASVVSVPRSPGVPHFTAIE